jgi:hypothetical protein
MTDQKSLTTMWSPSTGSLQVTLPPQPESIWYIIGDQAFSPSMIWLLPPSPVSTLSLFLSLPVCRRSSLLTGREGVGEEPNHKTARKSGPLPYSKYSLPPPIYHGEKVIKLLSCLLFALSAINLPFIFIISLWLSMSPFRSVTLLFRLSLFPFGLSLCPLGFHSALSVCHSALSVCHSACQAFTLPIRSVTLPL